MSVAPNGSVDDQTTDAAPGEMRDSVKAVLAAAVELPPGQRQAFLRDNCGDNAALFDEVRALLAAHEQAGLFLAAPTHANPSSPTSTSITNSHIGTQIGRYQLLEPIGEGGFGTVYLAQQEQPVRRQVALKIIKLGMDTRQVVARFEAERQALAVMDHPNIAKVLDGGATDSGRPYFVMELVHGTPITEYCDANHLSVPQRLELFAQVCRAVQHAHQKGIIHRDLKPSNVLVAPADGRATPKVIDFGIAKAIDQRLTEKTIFTDQRQMIGTPQYMSPEQADASDGAAIDTRTDVFSLGVLLYELLVGATPFDGKELRSKAYGEMQRIIREVEPPAPSTRLSALRESLASVAACREIEPARLGPLIRGELDWIVMRAMEKAPSRRYATADALAADVGRYLLGEAVTAAPPGRHYRLRKFLRRHRATLFVTSTIAVLLVSGLVSSVLLAARALRAEGDLIVQLATVKRERDRGDLKAAEAIANERVARQRLADSLVNAGDSVLNSGNPSRARESYLAALVIAESLGERDLGIRAAIVQSYESQAAPLLGDDGARVTTGGFEGHTSWVRGVTYSPDGRTALSASDDHTLRLWDVTTGGELRKFSGHTEPVRAVAFSPDGSRAISGGDDGIIRLWATDSGNLIRKFGNRTGGVRAVAFSPDGQLAISCGNDAGVRLWDVASGTEVRRFVGQSGWCLAFSPDGQSIVSGGKSDALCVWDVGSGALVRRFAGEPKSVESVAFAPDARSILSGGDDNTLRLWNVATGKEVRRFAGHTDSVLWVAFAPGGRRALSAGDDRSIRLWDVATGAEIRRFDMIAEEGRVCSVAFAHDGRTALSGGENAALRLWDISADPTTSRSRQVPAPTDRLFVHEPDGRTTVRTGEQHAPQPWDPAAGNELRRFEGRARDFRLFAFSRDGRTILSAAADHSLRLWDVATSFELRRLTGHTADVNCLAISPDGTTALSAGADDTLRLWNLSTGTEMRRLAGRVAGISSVALSSDGQSAVSGAGDGTVRTWSLASGAQTHAFVGHDGDVLSVAFSPDGRTIVSGGDDGTVRLWDSITGSELRRPWSGGKAIRCVAFLPDGRSAIAGGLDGVIRQWDLANGEELRQFAGHDGWIWSLAISANGRTICSAGLDHTTRLWDVASGAELRKLPIHLEWSLRAAFSPNGRIVLSGGRDHAMNLWDLDRPGRYALLERSLPSARAAILRNPADAAALLAFGQWYDLRNRDDWAIEFFERSRAAGGTVSPLSMARCYWKLGKFDEAGREFRMALKEAGAPMQYLQLCLVGLGHDKGKSAHDREAREVEQARFQDAANSYERAIMMAPADRWN